MRLSSLFVQGNQSYIDGNGREMDSASLEQNLKNGMEEIASKQPGQSVTGEVIEKNGSDILLAIGKNQMLRAKLAANGRNSRKCPDRQNGADYDAGGNEYRP